MGNEQSHTIDEILQRLDELGNDVAELQRQMLRPPTRRTRSRSPDPIKVGAPQGLEQKLTMNTLQTINTEKSDEMK